MIFSENSIEAILASRKNQTRRLVRYKDKYGSEWVYQDKSKLKEKIGKLFLTEIPCRYKIGKSYVVQASRGKRGLWYCPYCKKIDQPIEKRKGRFTHCFDCAIEGKAISYIPLKIVITSICKECLQDISNKDAKTEGYKTKRDFIRAFQAINISCIPRKVKFLGEWNPPVWAISFKLAEASE